MPLFGWKQNFAVLDCVIKCECHLLPNPLSRGGWSQTSFFFLLFFFFWLSSVSHSGSCDLAVWSFRYTQVHIHRFGYVCESKQLHVSVYQISEKGPREHGDDTLLMHLNQTSLFLFFYLFLIGGYCDVYVQKQQWYGDWYADLFHAYAATIHIRK